MTYYYAVYAYNTAGDCSEGAFSEGITPIEWSSVLAENSWEQIDSACTQGAAQSLWSIGDEIDITVLGEALTCVILDFNHDAIQDGGKAVITFGLKNLMQIQQTFGGTPYVKVFDDSDLYKWYIDTLSANALELNSFIKVAKKKCHSWTYNDNYNSYTLTMGVWPFSAKEIVGTSHSYYGTLSEGYQYPYFATATNRVKYLSNGFGMTSKYGLRSWSVQSETTGIGTREVGCCVWVDTTGNVPTPIRMWNAASDYLDELYGVCFGFCVGKNQLSN